MKGEVMDSQSASALRRVRERIGVPERWCKGAYARDATGDPVDPFLPEACKWCLSGARMVDGEQVSVWAAIVSQINRRYKKKTALKIAAFNDDPRTTHADILAVLDTAIAECEKGAGCG